MIVLWGTSKEGACFFRLTVFSWHRIAKEQSCQNSFSYNNWGYLYVPGIARSAPAPSRSSGSVAKLPPPAAFQVSLSIKKYSKISDTRSVLRTGFRSRYLASDAEGLMLSNSAGTFLTCKWSSVNLTRIPILNLRILFPVPQVEWISERCKLPRNVLLSTAPLPRNG